jgi:hypothetical protein
LNLALDNFADNPIVDELVYWPPKGSAVTSVVCSALTDEETTLCIKYRDGRELVQRFPTERILPHWPEAVVVVEALTDIKMISDIDHPPVENAENLADAALKHRDQCIEVSLGMFDEGMYELFLEQYGANHKNLPPDVIEKIALARREMRLGESNS